MKVSIIIPAYNEVQTIEKTVSQCLSLHLPDKEIIVVDNGSTDGTFEATQVLSLSQPEVVLLRETKRGKANAIRLALLQSRGDFIVFQDADAEYDPFQIPMIVKKLMEYEIVYGSRTGNLYEVGIGPFIANKLILNMMNKKFNASLKDVFTGQRGYRRNVLKSFEITSNGFELETELTIRALHGKYSYCECDVPYKPRRKVDGKKIGAADFFKILYSYFSLLSKSPSFDVKDIQSAHVAKSHNIT